MPIVLCNAPGYFQQWMDSIFFPFCDFFVVYIDDILVFNATLEEYKTHLQIFHDLVQKHGIVLSINKIVAYTTNVQIVGMHIKDGSINPQSLSHSCCSVY